MTSRGRAGRMLILVVLAGAIATSVGAAPMLVREARALLERAAAPTDRPPTPDDAPVLVLGGERERTALALTLPGIADGARDLIASAGAADDLEALGGDCDAPRVRCVVPVPLTTRGEARLAARLAAAEGWTAVTVVTSWWHVHRASLHLAACLDPLGVNVTFVPAGDPTVRPGPLRLIEEVVGSLDARLRPECADGGS